MAVCHSERSEASKPSQVRHYFADLRHFGRLPATPWHVTCDGKRPSSTYPRRSAVYRRRSASKPSQVGQQTVAGPCFSPHLRRFSPLCALHRRRSANKPSQVRVFRRTCDAFPLCVRSNVAGRPANRRRSASKPSQVHVFRLTCDAFPLCVRYTVAGRPTNRRRSVFFASPATLFASVCATPSQVGQQTVAGPCFSPHLRRISPLCALQRCRSATILQTCDTLARNLRHFGRLPATANVRPAHTLAGPLQTVAGPCFSPHLRRISPLCALQRRRSASKPSQVRVFRLTCDTSAGYLRHLGT